MQMRDREQRTQEMQREAAKPFARTRDDADLEAALKGVPFTFCLLLAVQCASR